MNNHEHIKNSQFQVLINYEGRYFVWPIEKTLPKGWSFEGKSGSRKECLQYLLDLWRIRKPLSLQQVVEEQGV